MNRAWLALITCYILWGIFPIFVYKVSTEMNNWEFLFNRFLFSLILLVIYYAYYGKLKANFKNIFAKKNILNALLTGVFLAMNYFLYIVAVHIGESNQASFGYFLSPIIQAGFGVLLFKEKLDIWKITAFCFAALAVLYQLVLGNLSILALAISLPFVIYVVIRKKLEIPPVFGFLCEMFWVSLIILPFWAIFFAKGINFNYLENIPKSLFYCFFAGAFTVIPFVLYLYGTQKLPLNLVALSQYSSSFLQLLVAIFYLKENITADRWVSFILIWIGLGIYSVHLLINLKRELK